MIIKDNDWCNLFILLCHVRVVPLYCVFLNFNAFAHHRIILVKCHIIYATFVRRTMYYTMTHVCSIYTNYIFKSLVIWLTWFEKPNKKRTKSNLDNGVIERRNFAESGTLSNHIRECNISSVELSKIHRSNKL